MWKNMFPKHSLCFPEPVSWQVLAASSVVRSAYSRPFASTSRLFESPWIHIRQILKQCIWGYHTIPNGCEKQLHLSTSPSNHVIAWSNSPYCFPWFGQHVPPYDLSCKGFCMNLLSLCSQVPSNSFRYSCNLAMSQKKGHPRYPKTR